MKRIGAIVAMLWLGGAAALTTATLSAQSVSVAGLGIQIEQSDQFFPYPVLRIGQDYTLKAGDTAREVVVVFGDVTIEGHVNRDVVVILGTARLASTAVIDQSLVVVGGNVAVAEGARIHEDLFVGGGGLEAPAGFGPGGQYVAVGSSALGSRLRAIVPWLTGGLLLGRPIVPGLPWVWTVAFIFFLINLLLNVVFDGPVRASATTLRATPLSAFMTGVLVMLLVGPVCALLAISVVGIAVIPFLLCALLVGVVLGKIAFARWLGMSVLHQEEPENKVQSFRSLLIGSAIMCLAYMVPILGLVTWAMAGVFGLGASTLAFFSAYRRENPKQAKKVKVVPAPPAAPSEPFAPSEPTVAYATPVASAFSADVPPAAEPLYAAVLAPAEPEAALPASDLVMLPRAAFVDRLAGFALDVILIAITVQVLAINREEGRVFFLLALAYHITFWTLKGTTLGGIICQLRLVRVDGRPLSFPDALVRALTGIFSLAVFGLGFLWILRDPERQAWHDRVAGTYVVKVPRNWPI
jgi:uncharacterized RDD family membrane protein YckC